MSDRPLKFNQQNPATVTFTVGLDDLYWDPENDCTLRVIQLGEDRVFYTTVQVESLPYKEFVRKFISYEEQANA